jgi:hypothetical protein
MWNDWTPDGVQLWFTQHVILTLLFLQYVVVQYCTYSNSVHATDTIAGNFFGAKAILANPYSAMPISTLGTSTASINMYGILYCAVVVCIRRPGR